MHTAERTNVNARIAFGVCSTLASAAVSAPPITVPITRCSAFTYVEPIDGCRMITAVSVTQ